MNRMIYNGKDFSEFSAVLTKSTFLKGAERDTTQFSVLGRNGVLVSDNGRFKPVPFTAELAVTENMQANMEAMRAFLAGCSGMCRYEESQTPEIYRMAILSKPFSPDLYDHIGGRVRLEFTAQPQRWLKSGEVPVRISANGSIYNPTFQEAKPLIKVTGTGSFGIGNITVTVASHSYDYIMIDCDAMLTYFGAYRAGEYVTMTNHEYPTLKPGMNGITVDGVSLEITPRWYEI